MTINEFAQNLDTTEDNLVDAVGEFRQDQNLDKILNSEEELFEPWNQW